MFSAIQHNYAVIINCFRQFLNPADRLTYPGLTLSLLRTKEFCWNFLISPALGEDPPCLAAPALGVQLSAYRRVAGRQGRGEAWSIGGLGNWVTLLETDRPKSMHQAHTNQTPSTQARFQSGKCQFGQKFLCKCKDKHCNLNCGH